MTVGFTIGEQVSYLCENGTVLIGAFGGRVSTRSDLNPTSPDYLILIRNGGKHYLPIDATLERV